MQLYEAERKTRTNERADRTTTYTMEKQASQQPAPRRCIRPVRQTDREHASRLMKHFCAVLMVFATATPMAAALGEPTDETTIITNWKNTARQTAVGSKLVDILQSTSSVLKTTPNHKQARYLRGYLYGIIGCTSSAIADLSKAIDLDRSFAPAYTERGICYMDMKDYEHARADLERAIALNPNSGDARLAHGKLMLELDKPSLAAGDFRACQMTAVKFTPALPGELPGNYYNAPEYYLGVCDESMGRLDAALKHFKSATKTPKMGGAGYIKRYSDQPLDAASRVSMMEATAQY